MSATAAVIAAFIMVMAGAFSAPASAAPAAPARTQIAAQPPNPYTEYYECYNTQYFTGYTQEKCDGTWYNGDYPNRDARMVATVRVYAGGYRENYVTYVRSLWGRGKYVTFYCRWPDGTSSSAKGTTSLGNGLALDHTWASPGYHPCDGTSGGIIAVFKDYQVNYPQVSTLDYNSELSGALEMRGVQSTSYPT
jgi:hypothetical protein